MGEFEKYVIDKFEHMPLHRVGNVFLRILGRLIAKFDNKDQKCISKSDLIEIIKEAVEHENNPRTTVDRLLNRAKNKSVDKR